MTQEREIDRIEKNIDRLTEKIDEFIESHNKSEVSMAERVKEVETKVAFQQRVIWGLIGGLIVAVGGHVATVLNVTP